MPVQSSDVPKDSNGLDLQKLPAECAVIEKSRLSPSEETIITIQDAHASLSAQYSITRLLDTLLKGYGVDFVAVEGSSGFVDTSVLRSFPDKALASKAGMDLMEMGYMSAGEFFAVQSDRQIALYGVDDDQLYRRDLEAYRFLSEPSEWRRSVFAGLDSLLRRAEEKAFDGRARSFVRKRDEYRAGAIGSAAYGVALSALATGAGVRTQSYPNMERLRLSVEAERSVCFDRANEQRAKVIDALSKKLDRKGLEELVGKSLAFKKGEISASAFHGCLAAAASEEGVSPDEYPDLIRYAGYIALCEKIDIVELQREFTGLEAEIARKIVAAGDGEDVYEGGILVRELSALFSLSLGDEEAGRLIARGSPALAADVERHVLRWESVCGSKKPIAIDRGRLAEELERALDFYRIAGARNEAMVANTVGRMRREGKRIAALITGGFHAGGMERLMEERKVSYVIVLPKFDNGSTRPYAAILTDRRWPLERLLKTGSYDIAVRQYFSSGDMADVLFSMELAVREVEPAKIGEVRSAWQKNYRAMYDALGAERARAVAGRRLTPDEFDELVELFTPEVVTMLRNTEELDREKARAIIEEADAMRRASSFSGGRRLAPENLLLKKYGNRLVAGDAVPSRSNGWYTTSVPGDGQAAHEEGAYYCNFIIIYDTSTRKGALIHVGICQDKNDIVATILKDACRAIGVRPDDRKYIRENVVSVIARPSRSEEGTFARLGMSDMVERLFANALADLGIDGTVDRDHAWYQSDVTLLPDEGLFVAPLVDRDGGIRVARSIDLNRVKREVQATRAGYAYTSPFLEGNTLSRQAHRDLTMKYGRRLVKGQETDVSLFPSKSYNTATMQSIGPGTVGSDFGAIYCNYLVIYDRSTKCAALVHTQVPDSLESAKALIGTAAASIGIRLHELTGDYIERNLVIMLARTDERTESGEASGADADSVERMLTAAARELNLPIMAIDRNGAWQLQEVRLLTDEGLLLVGKGAYFGSRTLFVDSRAIDLNDVRARWLAERAVRPPSSASLSWIGRSAGFRYSPYIHAWSLEELFKVGVPQLVLAMTQSVWLYIASLAVLGIAFIFAHIYNERAPPEAGGRSLFARAALTLRSLSRSDVANIFLAPALAAIAGWAIGISSLFPVESMSPDTWYGWMYCMIANPPGAVLGAMAAHFFINAVVVPLIRLFMPDARFAALGTGGKKGVREQETAALWEMAVQRRRQVEFKERAAIACSSLSHGPIDVLADMVRLVIDLRDDPVCPRMKPVLDELTELYREAFKARRDRGLPLIHEASGWAARLAAACTELEELVGDIPESHRELYDRIREIVRNRVRVAHTDVRSAAVGARALIDEAIGLCKMSGGRDPRQFVSVSCHGSPEIFGDRYSILISIADILQNALEVIPRKDGKVRVTVRESKGRVTIHIKDNGPGIGKRLLATDRFGKPRACELNVTTREHGTGLGLAGAYLMAKDHMGSLRIRRGRTWKTDIEIALPAHDDLILVGIPARLALSETERETMRREIARAGRSIPERVDVVFCGGQDAAEMTVALSREGKARGAVMTLPVYDSPALTSSMIVEELRRVLPGLSRDIFKLVNPKMSSLDETRDRLRALSSTELRAIQDELRNILPPIASKEMACVNLYTLNRRLSNLPHHGMDTGGDVNETTTVPDIGQAISIGVNTLGEAKLVAETHRDRMRRIFGADTSKYPRLQIRYMVRKEDRERVESVQKLLEKMDIADIISERDFIIINDTHSTIESVYQAIQVKERKQKVVIVDTFDERRQDETVPDDVTVVEYEGLATPHIYDAALRALSYDEQSISAFSSTLKKVRPRWFRLPKVSTIDYESLKKEFDIYQQVISAA